MGLIIGGAIGNITDRLVMGYIEGYGRALEGHVIDFIHFTLTINDTPVFPYIFNVADMAISTSIIVMLIFHKKIMPVTEDDSKESEVEGTEVASMKSGPEVQVVPETLSPETDKSEDGISNRIDDDDEVEDEDPALKRIEQEEVEEEDPSKKPEEGR